MTRYLWLSVPVCCAAALWSACGPPPNSCQVSADCFPDEVCVKSVCVNKTPVDGGDVSSDAGGGDGSTGGGDGVTGGGTVAGGGTQTGGGDATGHDAGVDAGMPDCETGDTLPCCSGRGTQTCGSDGTWSACDATVSSESCNGIDDDCNGTVDNDVLFSLPDGGVAMNVSCSAGVGACASSGSLACATDGGVECGAAVIQPTTEVCDDIDNDCDGQTDEGTKVLCMIDSDNDHYAGSAMQQEFCPDTTRPLFGNCPTGYVATSLGTDCNDADPAGFIAVSVRVDGDGDTYCTNAQAIDKCTDGSAPAGFTLVSACNAIIDCDDGDRGLYQRLPARPDSDLDGSCFGAQLNKCSGATLPSGFLDPANCATEDDCAATDASVFRTLNIAADSDGDRRCTTAGSNQCVGTTLPTGYRLTSECVAASDCAPGNPAAYRTTIVRTDTDNDTHCVGGTSSQCIGDGAYYAPSHYREASSCTAPDDCDDNEGSLYQSLSTMYADADNDSHCAGSAVTKCVGSTGIIPGYKESFWCADKTDCDDTSSSGRNVYRLVSLRSDTDKDYYCANDATNYCIGDSIPSGKRISCDGTDCNDNNKYANASCSQTIFSNTYTKTCPGQWLLTNWDFSWSCPAGFHTTAAQFIDDNGIGDGDNAYYTAESYNLLLNTAHSDFQCRTLSTGTDYFKVQVTCGDNTTAL